MALQLTGHAAEESLRARASLVLPPERLADLHADQPGDGTVALASARDVFPGLAPVAVASADRPPFWPVPKPDLAGASNAFARRGGPVGLRRRASGQRPASRPHGAVDLLPRAGRALDGRGHRRHDPRHPLVLAGRSERLGWALTSAYLDDQDVMIERLNPDDPSQYETLDGWSRFETERSIVTIDGAAPVTLTLRRTENGPVLTGSQFDLGPVTPAGHVAAPGLDRARAPATPRCRRG